MSFAEGFADGFANSYAQSYDAAERRKLFLEETEKKKKENLSRILPDVHKKSQELKALETRMNYLEERGLDEKTLNVLYSDPEALETAYDLLSTEGADWDPETVGTYVRSAATTKIPEVSWEDHLKQSFDWFSGLDIETMTPESILTGMADLEPQPTGVVEFKPVPKPKNEGEAGISPTQARTWEFQRKVFDERIVKVGQEYLNNLLSDPNANPQEVAQIQQDLAEYGSSNNSTMRMFEKFGELTLRNLEETLPPDAVAGLTENGMLFIDTPEGPMFNTQVPAVPTSGTPRIQTKQEWEQLAPGTEYIGPDGVTRRKG